MLAKQSSKQFEITIDNEVSLYQQKGTNDELKLEEISVDEEEDQNERKDNQDKLFEIEKSIEYQGNVVFSYKGPANKEILQIIDMIEEGIESNQLYSNLQACSQRFKQAADGLFRKGCTCFAGTLNISFAEFVFGVLIIALTFMFSFVIYDTDVPQKYNNSWQEYVKDKIFLYAFVFSIVGLFYLKVDRKIKYVFIVGIIAYVFLDVLLSQSVIDYQNSSEDANGQSIFFWVFSLFFLVNWSVVYIIWKFIEKKYSDIISLGCCSILEVYIVYGCGLFFLQSTLVDDGVSMWKRVIDVLLPLIVFLITLVYCYVHYNLFYSRTDAFKQILEEIAIAINNKQEQAFQSKEDELKNVMEANSFYYKMKNFLLKKCLLITQIVIFLSYYIFEGFFLYKMRSAIVRDTIDEENLFLSIFHIIFLPLFLVIGILISSTSMLMKNKTLIYPLLFGILALSMMIPLYDYINNKGTMYYISYYSIVGIPLIFIFWLTLSLFGYRYRKKYLYSLTFILTFFIIPIVILAISQSKNTFFDSDEQAFGVAVSLLSIGGVILIVIGVSKMIHMIMKTLRFGDSSVQSFLITIKYFNFEDVTYYLNGSFFIIGYTLLSYGLYKKPDDVSGDKKGIIYCLLTIYPLILILFNLVIRIKPFIDEGLQHFEENSNTILNKDYLSVREQNEKLNQLNTNKLIKRISIGVTILIFIVILPFLFIVTSREFFIYLMSLELFIPFFVGAFWLLKHIKDNNPQFQRFLVPFLISTAWGFCLVPFLSIIPTIALFINSESSQYGSFLKYSIDCGAILIMLGVTSFTIFFHILMNKLELDKLRRFIVYQVQVMLFHNAVKSEIITLHYLLDAYMRAKKPNIFRRSMLKGDPVFWIPFTSENDLNYSNEMVTTNEYKRLSENNQKKQKTKSKRSCIQYICCLESNVQELNTEAQKNDEKAPESLDEKLKLLGDQDQLEKQDEQQEQEEDILNIDQFLFPYMLKVKHYQDENEPKLLEKIEKRNKLHDLSCIDKSQKLEFKSSKSMQLSSISNENTLDSQYLSYSEHYLHVKESENAKLELLHHIFLQFSNNDNHESDDELIIYCDALQFIRISNLDLSDSFLSWAFDQSALVNWNYKTFGMDIRGFAVFLKKITDKFYFGQEQKTIYDLCVEQLYQNIMGNCPEVAINFKIQYRTMDQIQKKWEIMLKDSPFKISSNPELQKNANQSLVSINFERSLLQKRNKMLFGLDYSMEQQQEQKQESNENKQEEKSQRCKCSDCSLRCCLKSIWTFIKACCCFIPILIRSCLFGKKNPDQEQDQLAKLKNQNLVKRQKSPSWDTIVDLTIYTIQDSEKNYYKSKSNNIQKINFNLGNVLVIFDRLCDSYVFLSLAIHESIKWSFVTAFSINLSQFSIFDGQTGSNDTLGLTEKGEMASFPHPQFFLTKIIQVIGQNLFQMIMRTFIDSFVCNWSGQRPWVLMRETSIECFSDIHYLHICFAFVGLLIYYPFTTFIFPNFQFTQKLTDIKYQPSFLVLFQQGQLLILGATSFLRSEDNSDFEMLVTLSLVIVIQVINIALILRVWPCTVGWWNIVDIGLSLTVAIVCSGGLFIFVTGQSLIGTIVTTVCILLVIVGTYFFSKKIYQKNAPHQIKRVEDMPKIILSKDRNILRTKIAPLPLAKVH